MIASTTKRPRNVNAPRAAAILYGDWGTSKAYVIGLAFAVGGYASFWLIALMYVLTALVGLNYMIICRLYPDGGGVYASVRHRSEVISIVGAFLLIADYLVTAAISALSGFQYLGVPHPEKFAAAAILIIGLLNLLGPKHTGGLAFLISVPTAIVVVTLGLFSLPHLGAAIGHLQPLHGGFWTNWSGFVGIVLALSGVEAIANATGVMKLDPGSTDAQPSVRRTSTPAILWVMIEVCIFTALLGLAMHALGGLQIAGGVVGAIATNVGATATDWQLPIKASERGLMFVTFVIMAAIEISLLIDKPNARYFAVTILAVGLILRGLVHERRARKELPKTLPVQISHSVASDSLGGDPMLCAVRTKGRTLDFALREAKETKRRLYFLFVREQRFMTDDDRKRKWQDDDEAR